MVSKFSLRPFIVAASFLLLLLSGFGVLSVAQIALSGHVDFRAQYAAGYMVRSGHGNQLYDYDATARFQNEVVSPADGALPFEHLAYESLLYAPFSFLRYRTAYMAFFAANLVLLAVPFRMLKPYLAPLKELWVFLPVAMFACFLPVAMALIEGQDSIILLTLMIASSVALDRGNDRLAGTLIGLSLFKFQYALPIALLFLVWRRWRFISGFALSAAVVTGLSLWLTGFAGFASYVHLLLGLSAKFSSGLGVRYGVHPESMQNLRGLAYAATNGSSLATQVVTVISSGLVLAWAALKRPSFPHALLASLLMSYHYVIPDTSMMIFPLGLALGTSIAGNSRRSISIAMLVVFIFVGQAVFLLADIQLGLLAIPTLALFVLWDGGPSFVCEPSQSIGPRARLS